MGISTYHIHNVLKTYARKLKKATQRSDKNDAARPKGKEWIVVSTRTRHKSVIEQVTSDIVSRIIRGSSRNHVEPEDSAHPRGENGNGLSMKKADAELVYKVIDKEKGTVTKTFHIQKPELPEDQLEEVTENNVSH
ncbi:MAG: hypothetical protein JRJ47_13925 [Deltaproteobacteria bacterium]|nr:hypothetical protein [Deltaproteobacteria bacterium]